MQLGALLRIPKGAMMNQRELVNVLKRYLMDHELLSEQHFHGLGPDDIIRAYVIGPAGYPPIESEVLSKHVKDATDVGDFFLRVMADSARENILNLLPPEPKRV